MKKNLSMLMLICVLCSAAAQAARPQAILGPGTGTANFRVGYHETTNRVLSRDTTYILTGWYFIDSTYSLTIPAGTLIRGDSGSGGGLIIKRGAKIFAAGTRECPIVFTSNKPAGLRKPGDWGGVIILGSAPTNQPTTVKIEGGFGDFPNTAAQYGGTDPDDNSGVLQYIRLEFGGTVYSANNEINGLTFGGVGRGTTIDHIQVSFANDDDYEFFGGTVQAKYLIGWRSLDDTYDTDFGFAGRLQFCYTKRDPAIFDAVAGGSSNGFESDNEGSSPYAATPRTRARVSNMTLVGPAMDSTAANALNANWGISAMLRRATEFSIYNSVLMGWRNGINIRDTLTQRAAINGNLEVRNTSLAAPRSMVIVSSNPNTGNIAGFDPVVWFNTGTGNIGSAARQASDLAYNATIWNLDNTNNPVPPVGTEPDTAGTSYQGRLSGDAWFDSVKYRGAFDPSLPRNQQWDAGWSNYDPQNYDPEATVSNVAYDLIDSWNMISLPMDEVTNSSVTALFPSATSSAFSYQGSYVAAPSLVHGTGYWLKFSGSQSTNIIGCTAVTDTFTLNAKWNMIGSVAQPVSVANIISNPPGNVASSYFGYNGAYQLADTLKPGKAYWVKVNTAGQLYLNGFLGAAAPKQVPMSLETGKLNTLVIADQSGRTQNLYFGEDKENKISVNRYELPPLAPGEGLDARFSSGRMLEVSNDNTAEYSINVHGGSYPLSITMKSNQTVQILEIQKGNVVNKHVLAGNGTITIQDKNFDHLVLKTDWASLLPTAFALNQNYPNPFNPTTRFDIEVPKESRVEVSVYDILGQKIATLLNGVTTAGYHTMEWNAQNSHGNAVTSGIYFVRMNSEKFTAVRKIMLMK